MSVKIKVFDFQPENSDEINQFMEGVKVIENGLLISEGCLGVMYKDNSDVGMEKVNLVNAASGELAKAQKQFVLQEGLVRAYTGMIKKFGDERNDAQNKADEIKLELDTYMATYDTTLDDQVAALDKELSEITAQHQKTPKRDREPILLKFKEVEDKLKALKPKAEEYKTTFDKKSSELSATLGTYAVKAANLSGVVKENEGLLETAINDREHARVFIASTKQLIADLEAEGGLSVEIL